MTAASGFIPGLVEAMDMNSPEFRRTFPKIVLAVSGIGLLLVGAPATGPLSCFVRAPVWLARLQSEGRGVLEEILAELSRMEQVAPLLR